MSDFEVTVKEADDLYDASEYRKMYEFLRASLTGEDAAKNAHVEVYWRMARAGKLIAEYDESKKKDIIYEAFDYAKKALNADPENWTANKWYGIMLDLTSRFEGNKKRIENSYVMKEYFEKAIRLNPSDPTTLHCLGVWYFEFADLPWYMKKIASALFATPPEGSYEEALKNFMRAEELSPNFYCDNLVYLAKTYIRLKQNDKAREVLKKAIDFKVLIPDDERSKKEAEKLLKEVK